MTNRCNCLGQVRDLGARVRDPAPTTTSESQASFFSLEASILRHRLPPRPIKLSDSCFSRTPPRFLFVLSSK